MLLLFVYDKQFSDVLLSPFFAQLKVQTQPKRCSAFISHSIYLPVFGYSTLHQTMTVRKFQFLVPYKNRKIFDDFGSIQFLMLEFIFHFPDGTFKVNELSDHFNAEMLINILGEKANSILRHIIINIMTHKSNY